MFKLFPRMQTTALKGVIAGGLFAGEKDRIFLTRAVNLNELLADFDQRLSFTEGIMNQRPGEITSFRKKLRDGLVRKNLGVLCRLAFWPIVCQSMGTLSH